MHSSSRPQSSFSLLSHSSSSIQLDSNAQRFGLGIDGMKHTFLTRSSSATPSGRPHRTPDLSLVKIQENKALQNQTKLGMTSILRKSQSPAVVRLYAASIKKVKDGRELTTRPPKKKTLFSARPQAHIEASRDSRAIIAAATQKGRLPPVNQPERKAAKLCIDNRPRPPGVIPYFEKRIMASGMPSMEELFPKVELPLSPFRASSPRNEPDLVYSPHGVSDLLAESRCVAEKFRHPVVVEPVSAAEEVERTHILPRESRASPRPTTPSHIVSALEAIRRSHATGAAPTNSTAAARKRLIQVKAHLHWKKVTENPEMSGDASMHSGPRPQTVDSSIVVAHRGKIVKAMYNS